MFLTVKRKTIFTSIAIITAAVLICATVSFVAKSAYIEPTNGLTVVIDAGHGGIDGGVTGVNTQTPEAEINLAVAKSLRHFLLQKGYNVVMTRKNSDGLYGLSSKNKKLEDMQKRKEIIQNAAPDLLVSIHQNYFPRSNQRGAQVFYAPKSELGAEMAASMQQLLNTNLEASKRKAAEGDYFILQCSEYPSLLVECGFLSNPEDEALLLKAVYQEKIAYTLFCGIEMLIGGDGEKTDG